MTTSAAACRRPGGNLVRSNRSGHGTSKFPPSFIAGLACRRGSDSDFPRRKRPAFAAGLFSMRCVPVQFELPPRRGWTRASKQGVSSISWWLGRGFRRRYPGDARLAGGQRAGRHQGRCRPRARRARRLLVRAAGTVSGSDFGANGDCAAARSGFPISQGKRV